MTIRPLADARDDEEEITGRLCRVDRKLNQVMSAVLAVLGIAVGGIMYFFLKEPFGDYYAVMAAVTVAWAVPLFLEMWFRREDA